MGQISTSIQLMDNVSSVLANINKSIDRTVSAFESMDGSTGASFRDARASIEQTKGKINQLNEDLERNVQPLKRQNSLWDTMKSKISGAVAAYAGFQGLKNLGGLSDAITQTTARLDLMNDGMQSTGQLSDAIYASADRARGAYLETADAVSKLGTMAGDAFDSSEEIIAFTEQLNKQFTIAGTSIEGQQAAMLQLTQAMGSGALRGEELNSVLEQAPNIVRTIADYMDKPMGAIKDMAAEGEITSDIVKEAMLAAADETNKKFESMPKTLGQTWMEIKNAAVKSFEEISVQLSDALNGAQVTQFIDAIIGALPGIISAVSEVLSAVMQVGSFIAEHWSAIGPIIGGVVSAFLSFKAISSVVETIGQVTAGIKTFKKMTEGVEGLSGLFKVFSINPIFLAIAAVIGLVAAIAVLWKTNEGFRSAVTKAWNAIKDVFFAVWNGIADFFTKTIPAAFNGVLNFFKSIPGFFSGIWTSVKDTFSNVWAAMLSNPALNAIVTMIRSLWANLKTSLSGIWSGITTAAAGAWNMIKTVILGPVMMLLYLITGNFTKLKESLALIWNNIKMAAAMIWNGIKMAVISAAQGLRNGARSAIKGLATAVGTIFRGIAAVAKSIWNGIKRFVIGAAQTIRTKAVGAFRSLVSGIQERLSSVKSVVVSGFRGAIGYITSLPGRAVKWGKDFINGLISGITSKLSAVKDAVANIADTIAEWLHFSRPDVGPLREYEKWMPDFMRGMADGIKLNAPEVVGRVKGLAAELKPELAMDRETWEVPAAYAGRVRAAAGSTADSAGRTAVTDNRKIYVNMTVREEADENRLIAKLKGLLAEDLYSGAEGVHL